MVMGSKKIDEEIKRLSTTIAISAKKWKQFKVTAILNDKTAGDALGEAVELWLEKNKKLELE